MTISSILGFRGATTTTASPSTSFSHRPTSFHSPQNRGDVWIHSEGWKGGKKGESAALSALTLLAFLFFLNILQSCLQDMNYNNQPVYMLANGARREEVPTMVAVPADAAMPAAGMPMIPMTMPPARIKREAHRVKRDPSAPSGEQARHLQRVQQQQRHIDAGWEMVSVVKPSIKQWRRPLSPQSLPQDSSLDHPKGHAQDPTQDPHQLDQAVGRPSLVKVGLQGVSPHHTSTSSPSGVLFPDMQRVEVANDRVVSITPPPRPPPRPRPGPLSAEAPADGMVRVGSSSVEGMDADDSAQSVSSGAVESSEPATDKQEEYDLEGGATTERIKTATVTATVTTVPAVQAMAVPLAMVPFRPGGHVLTFVPLASTMRGVFNMLAGPLLRMVQTPRPSSTPPGLGAALGAGLRQGLREGVRNAMCCDLVVCEAHRLGSFGGVIGERVATTVSTVARWVCGEGEAGELKEAAQRGRSGGREGADGCRHHIEQCERRAGRRTAVSTIAALIEAFIIRRP